MYLPTQFIRCLSTAGFDRSSASWHEPHSKITNVISRDLIDAYKDRCLISPFEERTLHEESGMSYGVGPAGYDVRLAQDIHLPANGFALASTIERFDFPDWLAGEVKDKSSLARNGISMFNTHIDPGWSGYLTLEISNRRDFSFRLKAGQPIAQILFVGLPEPTKSPYEGKYQNQPNHPVAAIRERSKS